jgi:predicted GNAT superfamily acetyltransferase
MIVIRECRGFEELQACVDLQVEVWGYCEGDVIPRRVFLVAQKIGGQVIGAFDTGISGQGSGVRNEDGHAGSMIGFALALPGVKTGAKAHSGRPEEYLHSHMLAVREGYRNQKIGARLKLAQRDDALARGIGLMEWTFDPLEIKNAFLNIHKLGAVVRRYEENFYGASSSKLQGGLQTDRLVAEWWLDSPRVKAAVGEMGVSDVDEIEPELTIHVPAAVYSWKADDAQRNRAAAVQAENRELFQRAFADGLTVTSFTKDVEGKGTFHLGRWAEPHGETGIAPEMVSSASETVRDR